MPKFRVTSPDGKEYEINAPEGATEEQVLSYAKANFSTTPPEEPKQEPSTMDALKRGVGLAGRALVTGASAPVNAVADFLSGAYNVGANVLGSESRLPSMSQAQQQGMTNLGVPTPATTGEKALSAGVEALAGGGAQNVLLKAPISAGVEGAKRLATETPAAFGATAAGAAAAPVTFDFAKGVTGSDLAASMASLGMSTIAAGLGGKAGGALTGEKNAVVTMDEVKKRARESYAKMDDSGVAIKPLSAQGMVNDAEAALKAQRYIPDLHPEVETVLKDFRDVIGTQKVPFSTLEQLRAKANDLKASKDANIQRLGGILVGQVDNYISSLKPSDIMAGKGQLDEAVKNVVNARKDWRNMSRATVLEDALNVAEVKAAKPTASQAELIRDGFINIAKDKSKMALFSPDEQAAILQVTKGIPLDTALSQVARFNPMRSGLINAGSTGALAYGVGSGDAKSAALIASVMGGAGYTADKIQEMLRTSQGRKVISDILSGNTPKPAPSEMFRGLFTSQQQQQ